MLAYARMADIGHFDELRQGPGQLRDQWQAFASNVKVPWHQLGQQQTAIQRKILEDGVTYSVYNDPQGNSRPWSLEVLPMLIGPNDWAIIEQGVLQRARLLNAIATDVYSERRLLHDAQLPAAMVLGHPGYLRGLHGTTPPGGIYLHVMALDLVRAPDGAWWVVSQRTQAPSGLGYVMHNRLIISSQFPQAFRQMQVQHLASSYRGLLDTLQTLSIPCAEGDTPNIAFWTPGPYNETYFEHAYLARYLGLPLVEGGDLMVRDDRVYLKTAQGLVRIHGLLRRLDDDFCDPLELRPDSTLGVSGLMQAVRSGNVVVSNALGTSFLESPAMHGFLPALSTHLLNEPLSLPSLPTWWCGEAAAWQNVADQFDGKVIRPTYPPMYSPSGTVDSRPSFDAVMGPRLSPAEQKAWRERIERDPEAYTAQHFLPYSQTPVWQGNQLAMRGASLRVYALAQADGTWTVLPGGMTRIAARDAGPVSMQLGGSSMDTWVMNGRPVDTFTMLNKSTQVAEIKALVDKQRPVASRVAEQLFWMGRYTERAEMQLRMLQTIQSSFSAAPDSQTLLLPAWVALARNQGLLLSDPMDVPEQTMSLADFESALVQGLMLTNGEPQPGSLPFNLLELQRLAQLSRERISPEHDRLVRSIPSDFDAQVQAALTDHASLGLSALHDAFERLAIQIVAVTGGQSDHMTRDIGWRFLTLGRRIERLGSLTTMLDIFIAHGAWQHAIGFEALLKLLDSQITFTTRFQRRFEWQTLVATVVIDDTNLRALAGIMRRLRSQLLQLPEQAGPLSKLLDLLPQESVTFPFEKLVDEQEGIQVTQSLCQRLAQASWRLSDELALRYFVHAEPSAPTISV